MMIDFQTTPDGYRHWRVEIRPPIAFLRMDVTADQTLFPGYELKLNSYDLGVDIELYDAVQRLRFEHPEVGAVVIASAKDRVFCAGANIRMLAQSTHAHKVNFCKFTNETRNAIEDASACSGQFYLSAINGTAAGGGYELAMATDHLILVDDGSASVSLPEVPLLAVLPGTGGLTRLVDKRKVRRDLADVFCTTEEGVRGRKALDWRLVDEIVPTSRFDTTVDERAAERAAMSDRPTSSPALELTMLAREFHDTGVAYPHLSVDIDRSLGTAGLNIRIPDGLPASLDEVFSQGSDFWPLALARELDDALLHLRFNELELGTLVFKCSGALDTVAAHDQFLSDNEDQWLIREILLYWKRLLRRIDATSRTLFAFIEPGSCFSGFLAEILFSVDRSYMLDGVFEDDDRPPASIRLSRLNFDAFPMSNGLSRLETRFLGEPDSFSGAMELIGNDLSAGDAMAVGLITAAPDDIDWEDEIRILLEERASFSPDSLTAMEANLRFAGPETIETKIFGRLSAWQNWVFQRPNAVGEQGALRRYGTGMSPTYQTERI